MFIHFGQDLVTLSYRHVMIQNNGPRSHQYGEVRRRLKYSRHILKEANC